VANIELNSRACSIKRIGVSSHERRRATTPTANFPTEFLIDDSMIAEEFSAQHNMALSSGASMSTIAEIGVRIDESVFTLASDFNCDNIDYVTVNRICVKCPLI